MEVTRPIFVIGAGRSGSSVFHRMLCEHPHVAWLTAVSVRYPARTSWNGWVTAAYDYPLIGRYLKRRLKPVEGYDFWEHHCRGFRTPCRDLGAADLTAAARDRLRRVVASPLTAKRRRLLAKVTGWPRIGFLTGLFDDARFVHIKRDGRAVANSLIQQTWWRGWGGPAQWRWGMLTPEQQQLWEKHDRLFIVLAAIEWVRIMEATAKARQLVAPDRFMEVKYEDLCEDPVGVVREVMAFCELDWTPQVAEAVGGYRLRSANEKWRTELNDRQQEALQEALAKHLQTYGYGSCKD